jgi:hypothetical protein
LPHVVSWLVTAGTFSVKVIVGGETCIALMILAIQVHFDLSFAVKTTCHIQKKKSAKTVVAGEANLHLVQSKQTLDSLFKNITSTAPL